MLGRSALVFSAIAVLAGAGCQQDGTLRVSWDFTASSGGNQAAAAGCGQHGVDSILIAGADTSGDGLHAVTMCTPGFRELSVSPGTWSVAVSMLDFEGTTILGSDPNASIPAGKAVVTVDVPGAVSVDLDPPPACSDGIDNDRDGRIDLADPDCQNDPNGTTE